MIFSGQPRVPGTFTLCLQCVQVWDYAPHYIKNPMTETMMNADPDVFIKRGPARIGSRYLKCLYRGYTDATFETRSPMDPRDEYNTFGGPVMRSVVGDLVHVVFRNSCRCAATPASRCHVPSR